MESNMLKCEKLWTVAELWLLYPGQEEGGSGKREHMFTYMLV